MQHLCPRCRLAVSHDDDGSLLFCTHCGMPQVRLSSELAERMAAERSALEEGERTSEAPPPAVTSPWRGAMQTAATAGIVALGLTAVSLALPPVGLLAFLWAVSAPGVALGIFASRFRSLRLSGGFGARLGLLTGLCVILAMAAVNTSGLLINRYVQHSASRADAQFDAMFTQAKAAMLQNAGADAAASAASFARILDIPEFRAGILVASLGCFCLAYLAFSSIMGAIMGALRDRRTA